MLLESACIPIPSELVLPLGGNMASNGSITLFAANIAANSGSMVGSLIVYMLGYWGGSPFILKYGKFFLVSKKHFLKSEKAFKKYGSAVVFFGRLLPVIRTFISLPAGISHMDIKKFLLYSFLGMIPWNFTLLFLGYAFGQRYETIVRPLFKQFEHIVIAALLLTVILVLLRHIHKKNQIHIRRNG